MGNAPEKPPKGAVEKAVREEGGTEGGRITKVVYLDDNGNNLGAYPSQQLPEDPFSGLDGISGLTEPPYSLEQLVFLYEAHPVHAAALDQKTADVIGKGWQWEIDENRAEDEASAAGEEKERDELDEWFESLAPEEQDMKEVLAAVWDDKETVGWGLLECVRGPGGELKKLYHVPGHTVRAHKSGTKLLQMRNGKKVWFARWGALDDKGNQIRVDAKSGSVNVVRDPANELFVIRKTSRRSSWYGIPGYVAAIGWIALSNAARDDNMYLFENRREPRWAIILTNLSSNTDIEEDLRRAFTVDLKQPHRNILIPIEGNGEITFQKMSADLKTDGSFDKLSERADTAVLIAHRVPRERVANAQVGPLGGSTTMESSRIYKEAVVSPSQELLATRLNKLISVEYPKRNGKPRRGETSEPVVWKLVMDDLDLGEDKEELDQVISAFKADLITLREARNRLKLGPLMKPVQPRPDTGENMIDPTTGKPADSSLDEVESEYNDMLWSEIKGNSGYDDITPVAAPPDPATLAAQEQVAQIDRQVRELLRETRDAHEAIREIADAEPASS